MGSRDLKNLAGSSLWARWPTPTFGTRSLADRRPTMDCTTAPARIGFNVHRYAGCTDHVGIIVDCKMYVGVEGF